MVRDVWRRGAGLLVCVAVLGGVLASCSAQDDSKSGAAPVDASSAVTPRAGGRLVYALDADPNGIDPTQNAWDNPGIQLANALYDPMVAFDADGRTQPYLLRSMTPSADYKTWTLEVRPGINFQSGSPVTGEAMAYYFNKLRTGPLTSIPTKMISDVRAVPGEPLKVELKSSQAWATMPALLAGQGGYLISRAQLDDKDHAHSAPDGTGPFKRQKWDIGARFSLVRNPDYWRKAEGLPYLDAVDFVVVPDGKARVEMLERKEIDVLTAVWPWDQIALDEGLARRSTGDTIKVETDPGDTEKLTILFNTSHPPLDDVRIRRAIGYATDIRAVAAAEGWAAEELARGPINPRSALFSPADYPGYEPAKAQALVNEYLKDPKVKNKPKDGVAFALQGTNGSGSNFLNQLVDQWAKVGIKANVSYFDVKAGARTAVGGNFDAMMLRYFAAPDPDVLWHFFVSDTVDGTLPLNFARLKNKDITDGMNEGRSSLDTEVRKRAYAKVQKGLADQMPYLWLQMTQWRIATTNKVHDAHNVTLPDGGKAMPYIAGTHRLTETWVEQ